MRTNTTDANTPEEYLSTNAFTTNALARITYGIPAQRIAAAKRSILRLLTAKVAIDCSGDLMGHEIRTYMRAHEERVGIRYVSKLLCFPKYHAAGPSFEKREPPLQK